MTLINSAETAFKCQTDVGWARFFRGRITKAWRDVITTCCRERQLNELHNLTLWMRKTVDHIWKLCAALWRCRNGKLRGHDFEERKKIALEAMRAAVKRAYQETDSAAQPHHARILATNQSKRI